MMTVKGDNIPRPVTTFEEAGFPKYIYDTLVSQSFTKPTCIQSQGWPIALSGRDMVGIAETGSRKTLAFMLPGVVHVHNQDIVQVCNLLSVNSSHKGGRRAHRPSLGSN